MAVAVAAGGCATAAAAVAAGIAAALFGTADANAPALAVETASGSTV